MHVMNRSRIPLAACASLAASVLLVAACGMLDAAPATPTDGPVAGGAPTGKVSAGKPLLLLACLDDPAFYAAVRSMNMNAARCLVIYQQSGETNGRFDESKLRGEIGRLIPADYDGHAVLDFEEPWVGYLKKQPGTPEFTQGEQAMLRVLATAHAVRPNVKWTMYGIPSLPFFVNGPGGSVVGWDKGTKQSEDAQLEIARRAQPIVNACDWVSPSIYSPYLYSTNPEWTEATPAYAKANTAVALEMAKGKPVFPMVWHRVHDSNRKDALKIIPDSQFMQGQVTPALQAGAAGVVWWGADQYLARVGKLPETQGGGTAAAASAPRSTAATEQQILDAHVKKLQAMKQAF